MSTTIPMSTTYKTWNGEKRHVCQSPLPGFPKKMLAVQQGIGNRSDSPFKGIPLDDAFSDLNLDEDSFTPSLKSVESDIQDEDYEGDCDTEYCDTEDNGFSTPSSIASNISTPEPKFESPSQKRKPTFKVPYADAFRNQQEAFEVEDDSAFRVPASKKLCRRKPTPFHIGTTEARIEAHAFQPYDPLAALNPRSGLVEMPKVGYGSQGQANGMSIEELRERELYSFIATKY